MKQRRLKVGLQSKLLLLFAAVFFVPFFIFVNLVYDNISTLLEEKTVLYEKEVTTNALKQIDSLFMSLEGDVRALNQENFNKIVQKGENEFDSMEEFSGEKAAVEDMLLGLCALKREVDSAYVYTKGNMKYCVNPYFEIDNDYSAQGTEWFESLAYIVGSRPRLLAQGADMQISEKDHDVIPFVCPVKQSPMGTIEEGNIGVVQLNLSPEFFDSLYNAYIADGKKLLIFGNDRQMIYSSMKDNPQGKLVRDHWRTIRSNTYGSIIEEWNGRPLMLSYRTSGYSDVTFVVVTERLEYLGETRSFGFDMLIFTVFFVAAFTIIANQISKSISNPIRRLDQIITDVQHGRIEDEITIEHYGNKGLLKEHIKNLADTMNGLLATIQQQHYLEKQQEIEILEAQINPHFIYNTLDAIRWMAVMRKEPEIADMVKSLIQLLKSSIQIGKNTITIEEEIRQIKDYMVLQQLRYADSFTVEYCIDKELYQCKTLKFMLQPIVENAIFHGIDHDAKNGVISIGIHRNQDKIIYYIRDNGRGTSADNLKKLTKEDQDNAKGIGLNNVNRRIKEYFGQEYGIEIISAPGDGMIVKIVIPFIRAENEENDENIDC